MVSPTQLCWRYHSLPLNQRYIHVYIYSTLSLVYIYIVISCFWSLWPGEANWWLMAPKPLLKPIMLTYREYRILFIQPKYKSTGNHFSALKNYTEPHPPGANELNKCLIANASQRGSWSYLTSQYKCTLFYYKALIKLNADCADPCYQKS